MNPRYRLGANRPGRFRSNFDHLSNGQLGGDGCQPRSFPAEPSRGNHLPIGHGLAYARRALAPGDSPDKIGASPPLLGGPKGRCSAMRRALHENDAVASRRSTARIGPEAQAGNNGRSASHWLLSRQANLASDCPTRKAPFNRQAVTLHDF